jgi:hypothetical protein
VHRLAQKETRRVDSMTQQEQHGTLPGASMRKCTLSTHCYSMLAEPDARSPRMRVFLLLWILLVAAISMSPMGVKQRLHTTGHLHYVGHFFVFALTAAFALPGARLLRAQIFRSGMIVLLGVILEGAEAIANHNRIEKRDLLVDVLGIAAGFLVVKAISPPRRDAVTSL